MGGSRSLILAIALTLLAGCGEDYRDEPPGASATDVREVGGLDPQPETKAGSESTEFEAEDIEAAADAGRLVDLYCDGTVSEAQYQGCLAHVDEAEVCEADTEGKLDAITDYVRETGGEPC